MMQQWRLGLLAAMAVVVATTGCGSIVARGIAKAPNSYPNLTWFLPAPPVQLDYSDKFLTNFPERIVDVGPPVARLRYRVIEPAAYGLVVHMTNWVKGSRKEYKFTFHATLPAATNQWTAAPRGTVVLLHGYGLNLGSMAPWALRLAEDGWRCVLVDLRGHGKSTGSRIYFGTKETADLSQLLDALAHSGQLREPVAVMGESYGAALALRWKTLDPRVGPVVAIAPYAVLSNAVVNIGRDYSGLMPVCLVTSLARAGARDLPAVLKVPPGELDTTTVLKRDPIEALFVAGSEDNIAPAADVAELERLAGPGSRLIVLPGATHEAVTYYFDELTGPVLAWLNASP
jgi:pimeloyl-ACP methyl ester carboxylesterase